MTDAGIIPNSCTPDRPALCCSQSFHGRAATWPGIIEIMTLRTVALTMATVALTVSVGGITGRVHAQRSPASLVGAWTLNTELSDHPDEASGDGRDSSGQRGGARRGGGGGGGGR